MTEAEVEQAAVEYLTDLGYTHVFGPDLSVDGSCPERISYGDTILAGRLRAALARINRHLDSDTLEGVAKRIIRPDSPALLENNVAFQRHLTRGVDVQVRRNGQLRGDQAWLIDLHNPANNDWLVVNQMTVVQGKHNRRPDMIVFVNGMPLAVIELKNPEDETATIEAAWHQLQTYKDQIPALFDTNELLVVSDGTEAKVGSLTAGYERFGPWRTVDGSCLAANATPKLEVLMAGLFEKRRFLDFIRHFIFWETDDGYVKKIAGYHQYHAVNKAIEHTVRASAPTGDKRIGVVWHTQGSGKSISMVFYTGKLIVAPEMRNPTVVVITDRNDLDGQLFGQFCAAKGIIPAPLQAESREHLRDLLNVASGGVVFSTIQKFGAPRGERFPKLSDRRNIVVITDEAHRSHYEFIEGFARNVRDGLPNASFIGFTGTPIEFDDKSTPAVFGDYIDTYPISQAVEDNATVPIYYEARLARIALPEDKKPKVDIDFEDVTEGEEEAAKGKLKSRWAKLEAMVGTEERLSLVAKDIIDHFERRSEILNGKAMVVAMSRRIAVDLYDQIIQFRPEWHDVKDEAGSVKVIMTGAATDPLPYQQHIRNRPALKAIEKRFKDAKDPLRLVIVRDMWLTGFDAPCAHTLYVDKPMKGHGLMQAIARVNRVFRDKPSGLVVDYLGLAEQLRAAVSTYGGAHGDKPGIPIEAALRVLVEKAGVVRDMFHGFNYVAYFGTKAAGRLAALSGGANHICGLVDGKKRFMDGMAALNKAAGIAIHLEGARHLRDEVGYFQAVESNLRKYTTGASGKSSAELDAAIRQIVSGAVAADGVMDIFAVAGLKKPDISILSDQFLETVKSSPHQNLQLELLKKLLNDEIKSVSRRNVVQGRKFSEMLEKTLLAYTNRTLEAAQVILELIEMAKQMRDEPQRGGALGLTEDEVAFYDALVAHGGVKELMTDQVLAAIAHDLVDAIRSSVSIDWTQKEAVRADMRRKVKKLLRKHGYPPDKQAAAVVTVLEQAEALCKDWAETAPQPAQPTAPMAKILPFRPIRGAELKPFVNAVPRYDLKIAAGRFSATQAVDEVAQASELACPDDYEWVEIDNARAKPAPGLFVAQVVGESMNKRIPNGSWCLWRLNPTGSRQGKVVLAMHRDIQDPDLGGEFTVKVYYSENESLEDGEFRGHQVVLQPRSTDPGFRAIVLDGLLEGELVVVAELVEVLG